MSVVKSGFQLLLFLHLFRSSFVESLHECVFSRTNVVTFDNDIIDGRTPSRYTLLGTNDQSHIDSFQIEVILDKRKHCHHKSVVITALKKKIQLNPSNVTVDDAIQKGDVSIIVPPLRVDLIQGRGFKRVVLKPGIIVLYTPPNSVKILVLDSYVGTHNLSGACGNPCESGRKQEARRGGAHGTNRYWIYKVLSDKRNQQSKTKYPPRVKTTPPVLDGRNFHRKTNGGQYTKRKPKKPDDHSRRGNFYPDCYSGGFWRTNGSMWMVPDCSRIYSCTNSCVKHRNIPGCSYFADCVRDRQGATCLCRPGFTGNGLICTCLEDDSIPYRPSNAPRNNDGRHEPIDRNPVRNGPHTKTTSTNQQQLVRQPDPIILGRYPVKSIKYLEPVLFHSKGIHPVIMRGSPGKKNTYGKRNRLFPDPSGLPLRKTLNNFNPHGKNKSKTNPPSLPNSSETHLRKIDDGAIEWKRGRNLKKFPKIAPGLYKLSTNKNSQNRKRPCLKAGCKTTIRSDIKPVTKIIQLLNKKMTNPVLITHNHQFTTTSIVSNSISKKTGNGRPLYSYIPLYTSSAIRHVRTSAMQYSTGYPTADGRIDGLVVDPVPTIKTKLNKGENQGSTNHPSRNRPKPNTRNQNIPNILTKLKEFLKKVQKNQRPTNHPSINKPKPNTRNQNIPNIITKFKKFLKKVENQRPTNHPSINKPKPDTKWDVGTSIIKVDCTKINATGSRAKCRTSMPVQPISTNPTGVQGTIVLDSVDVPWNIDIEPKFITNNLTETLKPLQPKTDPGMRGNMQIDARLQSLFTEKPPIETGPKPGKCADGKTLSGLRYQLIKKLQHGVKGIRK